MQMDTARNIERSMQLTDTWLKEIMGVLEFENKDQAYTALRGTLHALRDRLTVEEATDLAAQLPLFIKGIFYDGWNPSGKPLRLKRDEFLDRIHAAFNHDVAIDPYVIFRKIMAFLEQKVSAGEIGDVMSNLPKDLKEML